MLGSVKPLKPQRPLLSNVPYFQEERGSSVWMTLGVQNPDKRRPGGLGMRAPDDGTGPQHLCCRQRPKAGRPAQGIDKDFTWPGEEAQAR
jgi:hypothetical protein